MEHNETLSGEFPLATALANGAQVSAAAEQAGMGRTTAYRWLATPEFRLRCAQMQQALRVQDVVCCMANTDHG